MIIHIGYPKCASTTLQYLFSRANINFLGCNPKEIPTKFYHRNIGSFFESTFRFGTNHDFEEKGKEVRKFLLKSNILQSTNTVLSFENICFRLTPWDIPTDIKISRLGKIIPDGSNILISYRKVKDFIISLFKNHVSFGYTEDINFFIKELITLKDFGWILDLNIKLLVKMLNEFTNYNKIILYNINGNYSFENLFEILKLEYNNIATPTSNKSLSFVHNELARNFNKTQRSTKSLLNWLEVHRVFPDCSLPEEYIFKISRDRKKQVDFISKMKSTSYVKESIKWPDLIKSIQTANDNFIKSTNKSKIIVLN